MKIVYHKSKNWLLLLLSAFFLLSSAFLMKGKAATKIWTGAVSTELESKK